MAIWYSEDIPKDHWAAKIPLESTTLYSTWARMKGEQWHFVEVAIAKDGIKAIHIDGVEVECSARTEVSKNLDRQED